MSDDFAYLDTVDEVPIMAMERPVARRAYMREYMRRRSRGSRPWAYSKRKIPFAPNGCGIS